MKWDINYVWESKQAKGLPWLQGIRKIFLGKLRSRREKGTSPGLVVLGDCRNKNLPAGRNNLIWGCIRVLQKNKTIKTCRYLRDLLWELARTNPGSSICKRKNQGNCWESKGLRIRRVTGVSHKAQKPRNQWLQCPRVKADGCLHSRREREYPSSTVLSCPYCQWSGWCSPIMIRAKLFYLI